MSDGDRAARRDDRAIAWLVQPTGPPADPGRFTPDLYPAGPPLLPAHAPRSGREVEVDGATFAVFLDVHLGGNRARIDAALDRFRDPQVIERLPDAGVRAGFLSLTGTLGDVLIEPFLAGELAVSGFAYGVPTEPSRVVGPSAELGPRWCAVNERYRHETFPLLAGSLLHQLLHHEPPVSDAEETVTHALLAAVHLQMISRSPHLVGPTELARRQSSLALSLLCSREPGQAEVRILAPDGLGTIPGGAPSMQTPDFWSIPFAPDLSAAQPPTGPMRLLLDALLDSKLEGAEADPPVVVDDRLAALLDLHVLARELRPHELLSAAVALTLAPPSL